MGNLLRNVVLRLMVVTAATALAACGTVTGASRPTATVDLDDPDAVAALGAPLPERVDWRRTVAGIDVLGIGTAPDPEELVLLEAALDDMPTELMAVGRPRAIVRTVAGGEETVARALAYAKGPDVVLTDRTFAAVAQGPARYDLGRALLHELTHVWQFRTLSQDYLEAVMAGDVAIIDPGAGSAVVRAFAKATGWEDRGDDPLAPRWVLPEDVATANAYARTSPVEDMAESVSLVAIGLADTVPDDRRRWVEDVLGASADDLARGRPWAPARSELVLVPHDLYDGDEVERIRGGARHLDVVAFQLPAGAPDATTIADLVEDRLRDHGVVGRLRPVDDPRVLRFAGAPLAPDGRRWWVELWDLREAPGLLEGTRVPLLLYVIPW